MEATEGRGDEALETSSGSARAMALMAVTEELEDPDREGGETLAARVASAGALRVKMAEVACCLQMPHHACAWAT